MLNIIKYLKKIKVILWWQKLCSLSNQYIRSYQTLCYQIKSRGYEFFQPNYQHILTYNGRCSLDKRDFRSQSNVLLLSLMSCIKTKSKGESINLYPCRKKYIQTLTLRLGIFAVLSVVFQCFNHTSPVFLDPHSTNWPKCFHTSSGLNWVYITISIMSYLFFDKESNLIC